MELKDNYQAYKQILDSRGIGKLYHFTDRENLESIIRNGGLYSWADCESKHIGIAKPGGSDVSRQLDRRDGLQNYVRVSFTERHPMMYVAMNDGRISNPVVLEIDPQVIWWSQTRYADRNATKNGARVGSELADFEAIHFGSVKAKTHFDLSDDEQPYYQAEVLVKNHIPLEYITNIGNFGIAVPNRPQTMQSKASYTAQITRKNPTAFIFLVDQSGSMRRTTTLLGEEMTMAEAAARIVNQQINDLVFRCIKSNEVRHYYDIAVIGYGEQAYSGWNGELHGRTFVSPEELRDNPFKKTIVREEKRSRRGTEVKEVEKVQWMEARCDGGWTRLDRAFEMAHGLLEEWMREHHDKDCYPPTIINITDGAFNGATKEHVLQQANELKSMFTNDGNVILFNIHFAPGKLAGEVLCPVDKGELGGDTYAETLFEMSSLLPLRYNNDIERNLGDNRQGRHVAMGMNADATSLIKLMDIGTPTNITR